MSSERTMDSPARDKEALLALLALGAQDVKAGRTELVGDVVERLRQQASQPPSAALRHRANSRGSP